MTLPSDQPIAHHLGFAAYDCRRMAELYEDLLGGAFRYSDYACHNLAGEPARLKVAYGAIAGMLIEIIEVVEGEMPQSEFLREHGEGLQHLGLWVPDVVAATERALRKGAVIEWAYESGSNHVAVIRPGDSIEAILEQVPPKGLTYLKTPGKVGGASIEFIGPATQARMRQPGHILEGRGELITARPPNWFTAES